jgi:hypothetical protein
MIVHLLEEFGVDRKAGRRTDNRINATAVAEGRSAVVNPFHDLSRGKDRNAVVATTLLALLNLFTLVDRVPMSRDVVRAIEVEYRHALYIT